MKKKQGRLALALFAGAAAMIAAAAADAAAPRRPQETQIRRPPPATQVDMDIWLRQLAGRFQWDGVLDIEPLVGREDGRDLLGVKGISDCIPIGKGAGVQCVLDVRWPEQYTFRGDPLAVPNLSPAMSMYGIDAARQRVVYLQVDNKGLPIGGPGSLEGSTAAFRAPCIGTDPQLAAASAPGQSLGDTGGRAPGGEGGGGDDAGGGSSSASESGAAATSQSTSRYSPSLGRNDGEPAPWMSCLWITRISARSDRNVIHLDIAYGDRADPTNRYILTLRRVLNPPQERKDAERKR